MLIKLNIQCKQSKAEESSTKDVSADSADVTTKTDDKKKDAHKVEHSM